VLKARQVVINGYPRIVVSCPIPSIISSLLNVNSVSMPETLIHNESVRHMKHTRALILSHRSQNGAAPVARDLSSLTVSRDSNCPACLGCHKPNSWEWGANRPGKHSLRILAWKAACAKGNGQKADARSLTRRTVDVGTKESNTCQYISASTAHTHFKPAIERSCIIQCTSLAAAWLRLALRVRLASSVPRCYKRP
jgi:hypothetical protein